MKLLYVGHTYCIQANQAKIAALAELPGVEVTLLTPDHWKGPLYNNKTDPFSAHYPQAVDHHILPISFAGRESAYFYRGGLFNLISKLKPDVVHVEQGAYALSYAQILVALKRFSPHTRATFFTWWNITYELTGLRGTIEPFNLRHSACAVTGNQDAKSILICRGFNRPIRVIPQLGVDPAVFSVPRPKREERPAELRAFAIGYFGRVEKEKGVLDLVEAVGQIGGKSQIVLYILGSGSALPEVMACAEALNVRVVCHPAVRNEEIPSHLALIDCLVLPSRTTPEWVEQFGHILIEAMAAGVPVVGSSSGEIPQVIQTGGRIFPEGDTEALGGILSAIASTEKLQQSLSQKGRERVNAEFTHTRIAQKQAELYSWMMEHGKSVGELASVRESA